MNVARTHHATAPTTIRSADDCSPLLRPEIKPEGWYRDAGRIPKPGTTVSESYVPTDATTAAPSASQWRRITSVSGEDLRIRIAKLDADWYVCET